MLTATALSEIKVNNVLSYNTKTAEQKKRFSYLNGTSNLQRPSSTHNQNPAHPTGSERLQGLLGNVCSLHPKKTEGKNIVLFIVFFCTYNSKSGADSKTRNIKRLVK